MGLIFYGKLPLLMTLIQVSDPGPKGPLDFFVVVFLLLLFLS